MLEEQGIVTIVHCVCEGNYYKVYHNETNKLVAILLDNKIYDRKNKVGSLVITT